MMLCGMSALPLAPWRLLAAILVSAGLLGCQTGPTPKPTARPVVSAPAATAQSTQPGASGAPPTTATGTPAAGSRPRIMIDTDVAPDDLIALASILRDPSVEILAITVAGTGEAHCEPGVRVVRAVVTALLEGPIPVSCGPAEPLGDAQPFPDEWRAGVDAGSGLSLPDPAFEPDPRDAEQIIVDLAEAEFDAGRRLRLLTLGTMTNLASALGLDPELAGKVRVYSMLGAVEVPGNVEVGPEPVAEWNAHADPTAARRVIEAGFDLTLVPLDATNDTPLTRELFDSLAADHAAGPADLVLELLTANPFMVDGSFYLWDPLAAAVIRNPDFVTTRETTVRVVEGAAPDGGRLLLDPAGTDVVFADSADGARFNAFLLDRLGFGGPRRT
jgi:inosine-uridine nucleoside N-ribohydrolase